MSRFMSFGLLLVVLSIATGANGFFFGLLSQALGNQGLANQGFANQGLTNQGLAGFTPVQQQCIIRANALNCGVNSPISCGRVGASQQCVRFQNVCSLQASNCIPGARYTPVAQNLCANVPLNTRGRCGGFGAAGTGLAGTGIAGTNLANTGLAGTGLVG